MKRLMCLILAVLSSLYLLAACASSGKPNDSSDVSGVGDESDTNETLTEKLGVPEQADYGGETFNILTAGNVAYEDFKFTEESTLALDNAQYKRKALVEQNYNIKIEQTMKKAYSSGGGPGYTQISTDCNAGDCNFDLALIAGYDVSVLAYSNFLYDLNSVPGIDLSKSWWDQKANENLSVNGVMFFTTGEITVSDNDAAFVILFNKELHEAYNLEDPYQLVYDGKWTMDKFAELCKTVTEDLNQDGLMNQNDRFGVMVWDDSVMGIVNGAGQQCCTIADDGTIELTIYNETTVAALEKYFDIAFDTQYAITYQRVTNDPISMWQNDQALFWMTTMQVIPKLREMESDFGVLPYPKLNEMQDSYYITIAPYNSQFICVPLIQNDLERTGVITEALAYYGKQIVTPAYYDVNLIGQSTRDEESADMLDIIFDSLVFDIGYYYQIGPYNKQLILMVREYNRSFASMYDTYKNSAQNLLRVINQYYQAAVSEWVEQ